MPSSFFRRATGAVAAAATACALAVVPVTAASAAIVPEPIQHSADADARLSLTPISTFETGVFDESAAEIVAFHGNRLFVVNAQEGAVTVLGIGESAEMTELYKITSEGVANSVAVREDGLGVIAFENENKTANGHLLFFDATTETATVLGQVEVGALPDMVTFSPDGAYAVVANEGEPSEDFTRDPEGSIGVVSLPAVGTLAAPAQDDVRIADFHAFEEDGDLTLHPDVRVFGPTPHDDRPVSRNLEPEYVTVSGTTAYAVLQEANAVAVVDLPTATVTDIWPLGFQDHGEIPLDPSDRDDRAELRTYEGLFGIYMPDGIESYEVEGATYLVTANEGDAREWGDYAEATRVGSIARNGHGPVCDDSPLAPYLGNAHLGRLNVTIENGFDAERGCYEELYAFGSRSFSIWTADGEQVFDSGSQFEEILLEVAPEYFNSNHTEANLEGRSDDKGPEPENLAIGKVGDRTYAFIGFERVGGIIVYDITDPRDAQYVTYVNNRDFSVRGDLNDPATLSAAGDLGPEGVAFIPAAQSPTGEPLLAVGNEVSGTTTLFAIEDRLVNLQVLTINDFHGRLEQNLGSGEAGAAVLAGAVKQLREENPNTIFVHSGDNIGASTFTSFISQDEPTIEALVAAGLELGAVGNHEFDQGWDDLTGRVTESFGSPDFNLGANVYWKGTTDPALPEYAVREVGGVDIAFIGLVTPSTGTLVSPAGISEIEFGDMLEAADRAADEITSEGLADIIVLLVHEGSAAANCTAVAADASDYGTLIREASADIDAIVSGHTHQRYACDIAGPDGVERPVIQAHQYGTTLGQLDIVADRSTGELVSISADLLPLVVEGAAAYPADPEVAQIVADAVAIADVEGAVVIGKITESITRATTPTGTEDRGAESTLGNLLADIYLWATSNESYAGTPAQLALMNPGGIRADLHPGPDGDITYRDVATVQPFANTLMTLPLTGAQIKQILEEQWQPDGAARAYLHLGVSEGFSYVYDASAPRNQRIVSMTLNGEEIAPTDEIVVVTNSFLAAGGDNFFTFAQATRTDTGQVDLEATVRYFQAHPVVEPAPLGRAVAADGEPGPVDPGQPGEPGGPTPPPAPGGQDPAPQDPGALPTTGGTPDPRLLDDSNRGAADIRSVSGQQVTVYVGSAYAGQTVYAWLFSEPVYLGAHVVTEEGTITVTLPAGVTGDHRIAVYDAEGNIIGWTEISIPADRLAATGAAQLPLGIAFAGATLLVAGGLLQVLRRRQRSIA
ncbi:choice-of-anchor I family protein [Microbacterium album]|uniref:Bifunctional metallophosphatase/5'-nucleotidase n=1 Tax=Microbacterium album TaxID=2053191 RepID=A0A917IFL6_9MICO|nr:choice-of-anchor I family protein [Microbacterium album]GGH48739.1 hypothetical protein GCM10010921_26440 [Microbacterium album]